MYRVNAIIVTMTKWIPDLQNHSGPRYAAIADALAADVALGRFKPGDRLPTHRDLAWRLGVTVGTVSRAYAEAERRGLVSGEVGRGTYVRTAIAAETQMKLHTQEAAGLIDLNFNFPPMGGEDRMFSSVLQDLANDPASPTLLTYQPHEGIDTHRAAGAEWLALSGLTVPVEQTLVTAGAQHGIVTVLAALTRPGDKILTESLTYPGIQLAARLLGLRLEGLPMDGDGLLPDAFEAACRNGGAKALYCIPTLQNPTTASLPEERRRAIAEIAEHHGVAVVEDDLFRLMAPEAPPPICRFAPDQGYYITSLSKTVAPGLRLGFVAGPARATERLATAVRTTCWMASPLTGEIAARWIRDGTAKRIMEARRRETAARREIAFDILGQWDLDCAPGALHFWLHLPEPWRSMDFAAEAKQRGIGITPAEAFTVERRAVVHAVRVCYGAAANRQSLSQALRIIAELLEERPSRAFDSIV